MDQDLRPDHDCGEGRVQERSGDELPNGHVFRHMGQVEKASPRAVGSPSAVGKVGPGAGAERTS